MLPRMLIGPFLFLALLACSPPPAEAPAAASPKPAGVAALDEAEVLRATARRLAGLEREGAWAAHADAMDEIWRQMEESHLRAMRAWQASTLAPLVDEPRLAAFYPFGGPNFLDAYVFLPEAPVYVLVGLEPPGPIPDAAALSEAELRAVSERLAGSFRNLVKAGYFVTTQMGKDLVEAESFEGFLPMLYIFLARTGHRPVAVHYVVFDEEGRASDSAAATPGEGGAVRVDFVAEKDGSPVRSLYYVSQDLSDEGLAARPGFLGFLRAQGPLNTLMKSAEYLLHMEGFRTLHDFLLAQSRLILQDDSGLPNKSLVASGMDVRYFGSYHGVIAAYAPYRQEDLIAAYADGAPPLGFNVGYDVNLPGGCLILARRTGP